MEHEGGEEAVRTLARRARAGDAMAFEAIVRRYQHRVHALAYRLLYDAELARDVAQEVFLRLHQNLHRYDPERPFEPWFLRLATNYALNARQKALLRRTASLDAGREDDGPRRDPPDPGTVQATEAAAAREEREAVREAVRALPDKYAGVVALHYLEGLGVKDIAARLDLPAGTVKIRLHRARALLRERLARLRRQGDTR